MKVQSVGIMVTWMLCAAVATGVERGDGTRVLGREGVHAVTRAEVRSWGSAPCDPGVPVLHDRTSALPPLARPSRGRTRGAP